MMSLVSKPSRLYIGAGSRRRRVAALNVCSIDATDKDLVTRNFNLFAHIIISKCHAMPSRTFCASRPGASGGLLRDRKTRIDTGAIVRTV